MRRNMDLCRDILLQMEDADRLLNQSIDELKEKGYSLSAGQYFDIKIDYVDITEEEFNSRMADYKQILSDQFAESHRLEEEIMKQLDALQFNSNVGNNE